MSTKTSKASQNSSNFSTILFSNGIYQGFLSNNQQREGFGVYLWDTGELYFGEWQHDEIHGEGYFFKESGSFLHAFFEKGQASGLGVLKTRENCLILGFWKHGALEDRAIKYFFKENQWFLCDFAEKSFVKCERTGKGFPNEGFPEAKNSEFRRELSDLAVILQENNKKFKENQGLEFTYKNFEDGGVFLGLTLRNVPHGLGIFKFPDDKTHAGVYKDGVLEGPCFINFQNGDVFCGELKKQKFENLAITYQKKSNCWNLCEFRGGVQAKVLREIRDFREEISKLSCNIFKKYSEKTVKKNTAKTLFLEPVFPALEELMDFQAKDWGLSPIKTKKLEEKSANERKINIYEIILNENEGFPTKMSTKTHDSQHFFSENSQREMLEDPKELSINRETQGSQVLEEVKRKESVFSKKKQEETEKKPWKSTIKMKKNVDFPNKIKEMMDNVTGKVAEVEEKMRKNGEMRQNIENKQQNIQENADNNPIYLDILEGKIRGKAGIIDKKSEIIEKIEENTIKNEDFTEKNEEFTEKNEKTIENSEKTIATEKKKAKFEENDEAPSQNQYNLQGKLEKSPNLKEDEQKAKRETEFSLKKVEEMSENIDTLMKNWEKNREITHNFEKSRMTCSLNEIHEYYDTLESCYRDLGVGKGELLDLILKRFKQELDRKFPQFANIPGFLYQKFQIPVVSQENPNNIRAVVPLFVRIPLKNN